MNRLEDFIKEHKEEFDAEIPSDRIWLSIEAKLHNRQRELLWKPYVAAASVMLFISFTWIIANHKLNANSEFVKSEIPLEVKEAQVQFSSLIEIKRNELNQYRNSNPDLISEFEHQLVELQKNYAILLPQLKDENKKDIILQAVIENLQMQVDILNQQIEIINQLKQQNTNETDKIVPL